MWFRRKNVLPLPSLQLQLIFTCFFFAVCSGMLQAIMVQQLVSDLFAGIPASTMSVSQSEVSSLGMRQFLISSLLMFPLVFGLGVLVTFRFAGPIVHFQKYFSRIAAGEDPGRIRLRKGDDLHLLAETINLALDVMRKRSGEKSAAAPTGEANSVPDPRTLEQSAP